MSSPNPPNPTRAEAIRAAMQAHAASTLDAMNAKAAKPAKKKGSKPAKRAKAAPAPTAPEPLVTLQQLLDKGAAKAGSVQLATHIVKTINSSLHQAEVTNLCIEPRELPDHGLVGSYAMGESYDVDATGNGGGSKAVRDAYVALSAPFEGTTVLRLLQAGDPDAIAALSTDGDQAQFMASQLVAIDATLCRGYATHSLAKQIYWPVADDSAALHQDRGFHLLAPIYPSSLAHKVYKHLQAERFGEDAQAARQAQRANQWHARPVREYPSLGSQAFGGSNAQNISSLTAARQGRTPLLPSFPPSWKSGGVKPAIGVTSAFIALRRRPIVFQLLDTLKHGSLLSDRERRNELDACIEEMLDDFAQFTSEQRLLPSGWSLEPDCELPVAHAAWLDPSAHPEPPADLPETLARDFATWLNHEMRRARSVGEAQFAAWRAAALQTIESLHLESQP